MEGDERIILTPPASATVSASGQTMLGVGQDIPVYAIRQDRGGYTQAGQVVDTQSGNWTTRFEIVRSPIFESLNVDWQLRDYYGNEYDIEAISAVASKRVHWHIYCVRRDRRADGT